MKKLFVAGLVSLALSASLAQAKFFIGVDAGYDYSKVTPKFIANNMGDILWGSSVFYSPTFIDFHSWVAGINLGTSHDITDNFGLRWVLGGNYAQAIEPKNTLQSIDIYLGIDTLLTFVNTGSMKFGAIMGLEANFYLYDYVDNMFGSRDSHLATANVSAGASARLGLGLGLGEHNSFEFLLRIPVAESNLDGGAFYSPLRFTLGYKVLF